MDEVSSAEGLHSGLFTDAAALLGMVMNCKSVLEDFGLLAHIRERYFQGKIA